VRRNGLAVNRASCDNLRVEAGGEAHQLRRAGSTGFQLQEGLIMSIARVTEIIASSPTSMEDAIRNGIERACKTLENVEGAWVQQTTVKVKDGKISEYRVNLKVTFILQD
jgi:hypothetical protein